MSAASGMPSSRLTSRNRPPGDVAGGAALGIAAWLLLRTIGDFLPPWLRFTLTAAALVFGPGAAAICTLASRVAMLPRLVLSFGFGMAVAPALGHGLGKLGAIEIYPYIATALGGSVLAVWWRRSQAAPGTPPRARVAAFLIAVLALTMGNVAYANRIREEPDRTVLFGEYDSYDITYYAAIAAELSHTVPPESPFIAGRSLNHAFYPHLVVALIHRFGNLPILDLYFQYVWPAFLLLAALACFVFVQSIATTGVALLSAVLFITGGSLSYVVAWLRPPDTHLWDGVMWSVNFASPGASSLLFNNWSPTLCVLFAGLYALAAAEREVSRGWLVAASACFAVTAQFKPFAYGLMLFGLVGAAALASDGTVRQRLLKTAGLTLLLSTPYVYRMFALWNDAPATIRPALLSLPQIMLAKLDLGDVFYGWAASLGARGAATVVAGALLALPLFLIGGLGFRLFALPGVWRSLKGRADEASIFGVLGWTIVSAAVIPLVITVVPYFETLQFYQLALFLLPIFVARAAVKSRPQWQNLAVAAAIIASAVPSTSHYLTMKWTDYERPFAQLRAPELPVVELLRLQDPETTRVLHNRPRRSALVGIAAARRSVLAWADYVSGKPDWIRIERFFEPVDESSADAFDLLAEYRPSHVLEYRKADRIYPDVRERLHLMFENDEVALYSVPERLWHRQVARGR